MQLLIILRKFSELLTVSSCIIIKWRGRNGGKPPLA